MGCCASRWIQNSSSGSQEASSKGVGNPGFTNIDEKGIALKNIDNEPDNNDITERYHREPPTSVNGNKNKKDKPRQIVKAIWDYGFNPDGDAENDEMVFKAGELMEIIKSDEDWWLARKIDGSEEGYIPSNFVQIVDNPLSHPWYHGKVTRRQAENRLRENVNDAGTFLIRESDDPACTYALSILTADSANNDSRVVKHYRIKYSLSEGGYYISSQRTFPSIYDLVTGYIEDYQGLCCALTVACPRVRPPLYDLCKSNRNNPTIPIQDLTFGDKLSKGNFGEVYKGKYKDRQDVAIKKLIAGSMPVEQFLEEAMVMKTLRHERLVALLAVCSDDGTHYIITELLRCSLLDFLRKSPEQHINILLHISSQIAEGMAYMENMGYIHRDLAARNVLMVDDHTIKIGDFGLSRIVQDDGIYQASSDSKSPVRWTAYEALLDGTFTIKSDVWSFGVVLVELTGKGLQPYSLETNVKPSNLAMWLSRGHRHSRPPACPEQLYSLMLQCWASEPESRPSFSDIAIEIEKILEDFDALGGYRN